MDLRLDHVLLAVADLDEAAARLGTDPGLTAFPGGRHPGVGTANMIVPLGRDYLELIAIVDEAEAARMPRSRRVRDAVEEGRTFAGWAVRTDDLDELRTSLDRLGVASRDPFDGGRVRPDGVLLRWRTLELVHPGPPDPFFIEWHVPAGAHPAEQPAAHRSRATGIGKVTAGSGGKVLEMLREAGVPVEIAAGAEPGVVSIELDTPAGPVVIR
jgi:hypothetical protein